MAVISPRSDVGKPPANSGATLKSVLIIHIKASRPGVGDDGEFDEEMFGSPNKTRTCNPSVNS